MDITLSLLPWKLLWGLQMKKTEKIGVAIAMSMGILYVPALEPRISTRSFLQLHSSAGVTCIVKTTKLETMLSADMCRHPPPFPGALTSTRRTGC